MLFCPLRMPNSPPATRILARITTHLWLNSLRTHKQGKRCNICAIVHICGVSPCLPSKKISFNTSQPCSTISLKLIKAPASPFEGSTPWWTSHLRSSRASYVSSPSPWKSRVLLSASDPKRHERLSDQSTFLVPPPFLCVKNIHSSRWKQKVSECVREKRFLYNIKSFNSMTQKSQTIS